LDDVEPRKEGVSMRIAQVSPLYESVPPRLYGGTERVLHYLTEELVRLGHDVTLFASGDSRTSASLRAQCDQALRLDESCIDPLAMLGAMAYYLFRQTKHDQHQAHERVS